MNLEQETRDGYVVSAEMKKVWSVQMTLLKKLLEVCQKHNLKVWADGGTLLGAIRHKGYIPWDDDIDMVMLRDDYNKLVAIAEQEFQEPFFFQTTYSDNMYFQGCAKLRYNGTAAIFAKDIDIDFNQSIFIDIFCYDAVPKTGRDKFYILWRAEHLRMLLNWRTQCHFSWHNHKISIRYLLARLYFMRHSINDTCRKFEQWYSNTDVELSDTLSCASFSIEQAFNISRDKSWYNDTIMMPFEDIMIPVPSGYDEILKDQYGDYMTPVKGTSLHSEMILDTERSYKDVIKDIKSGKIDISKYIWW